MRWLKRLLWAVAILALVAVSLLSLRSAPLPVELSTVARGTVQQTVDEDGHTRVRERYTVSAPLAGTLQRITLEEGDRGEGRRRAGSAGAESRGAAGPAHPRRTGAAPRRRPGTGACAPAALTARAEANLEQSKTDLERTRKLAARNIVSRSQLEHDALAVTVNQRLLDVARFEQRTAVHEVAQARAALAASKVAAEPSMGDLLDVRSPVDGTVLRVLQKSAGPVAIGDAAAGNRRSQRHGSGG